MKVLAIDYGKKRVGFAIGDEELKVAVPKGVAKNDGALFLYIKTLIKDYGIKKLVVGLPLTPSGKEGQRAKEVKEFVKRLKEEIKDIEIVLWDERYTTQEAERNLRHLSGKKRKEIVDAVSALEILKEYLNSL